LELVSALAGKPISFQQAMAGTEASDEEGEGVFRLYTLLAARFGFENFTAAELIQVENLSAESWDDRACLQSALEDAAGTPFRGVVDARAVAKKLQPLVDRPCAVGEGIWTLRRHNDRNHGNRYHLERNIGYLTS
jgi:hypothetical protein